MFLRQSVLIDTQFRLAKLSDGSEIIGIELEWLQIFSYVEAVKENQYKIIEYNS